MLTWCQFLEVIGVPVAQWRSKLGNWGGGGNIHIFVLYTDHENNRFQRKLVMQNTNI